MSNWLQKMEEKYGSRKPGEAGNGGAQCHAGGAFPTSPESVAAAVAKSFKVPGEGSGLTYELIKRYAEGTVAHFSTNETSNQIESAQEEPWFTLTSPWVSYVPRSFKSVSITPKSTIWQGIRWTTFGGRRITGAFVDEGETWDETDQCKECGAAYKAKTGHLCAQPSALDLDTVRTMQSLAGEGLSPEEIASDMNLRLGWRHWGMTRRGLSGSGAGHKTPWLPDRPVLAVCASDGCAAGRFRHCEGDPESVAKPSCRVHAAKERDIVAESADDDIWTAGNNLLTGRVAMWGDVIECGSGWLATRAYPIELPEIWARMYRVCVLP